MKFFLTGGTGFIGRHFITKALAAGHQINALYRDASHQKLPPDSNLNWIQGDLENVPASSFENCDVLVHLAAHGVVYNMGADDWQECFRWNVNACLDLFQKASNCGINRFVACGSCFEYGLAALKHDFIPVTAALEPVSAYAASKAAATMALYGLAVANQWDMTILRPFHVYGEGEHPSRFWPMLKLAALSGSDFPMTKGEQIRDFVPVELVADRILAAAACPTAQSGAPVIENVGTGHAQSLRDFAEKWWNHYQAKGQILIGSIPYRDHEIMRYVPFLSDVNLSTTPSENESKSFIRAV